jgi:type VI secretion system protein ImpA
LFVAHSARSERQPLEKRREEALMGSPAVLDLDALEGPVSEELPAGANLREDISPGSTYYRIKDARQAARAAERAAVLDEEKEDAGLAEWRPVLELAPQALASQTKDLEILAWLIEALARSSGFAGLRDGFRVARTWVERYWGALHPMPDEDGLVTTMAPFAGLNGEGADGTLIIPIKKIPITADTPAGQFAWWHYTQARDIARIEDDEKRAQREAASPVTMERFETALRTSQPQFLVDLLDDIQQSLAEFDALCAALTERCGADAPPSSNIKNAIEAVLDTVRFVAKDLLPASTAAGDPAPASGDGAAPAPAAAAAAPAASAGTLETREDAFETLRKVAEYFRRSEPHSPVSYLLEQAVRWGRMPLPDLLEELVRDDGARSSIFQLTGIRKGESE